LSKIWIFLKNYPLPVFCLFGLLTGGVFRFGFGRLDICEWIWFATLVIGGVPIIYQTIKGMLRGQFASDIVAMLAIITAILTGQAFAGAVIVLMQSGGEAIEYYGMKRAASSLTALLERAPRIARRKRDGQIEEIPVDDVLVKDLLIVRPGDLIPVDGTIVEGEAEIDASALTGEPLARRKIVDDRVLSGSVNVEGAITIRADKISQESQYAKIVIMVKKAQAEKAPIQRLADRYAVFFTPLTLVIALIGFLVTKEFSTVLAVLVVATPCPLILATPIAVICGINRASDAGIIVKGGAAMEQIASVKAALFDKTGTITFGTPKVEKIVALSNMREPDILYHAAIIEQYSSHSIASAICKKALETHPKTPLPQLFKEFPGQGVEGQIDGQRYLVGPYEFLEKQLGKENVKDAREAASLYGEKGKALVFLVQNHTCLGCLILCDQIRPNVSALMEKLRKLGVKETAILTGDNKKNGEAIAKQAGIKRVEAELLPEQKAAIVQQYKTLYGSVMMVGDGINDAPALATATVGVAMGAYGTAISAESADIVLLVDDLSKVALAMSIGKRMIYIAKQSIMVGIGLSFVLMVIAVFGGISPPVGAMLQEIIDVAVILNALRAR
jgi:ATPase, P-type (transporting), HAD superfamily, subfamily IC/ATPase, P-type (transporting), HAD superfamily, subfamily IC/heavy metal translocating P-type ATPase